MNLLIFLYEQLGRTLQCLLSLRVIWVFGTESDRGGDEAIRGVSGDLDHDAAGDVLVDAGPGHQVEEGAQQEQDEYDFKIIGIDSDSFCAGKAFVDEFEVCPLAKDKEFPDFCNKILEKYHPDIWIPIIDYAFAINKQPYPII